MYADGREELYRIEPSFKRVLDDVGVLDIESLKRPVYVSLIGAILGQKISYHEAKKLRSHVFNVLGTNFTLNDYLGAEIAFITLIPHEKRSIINNLNTYLGGKPSSYLADVNNIILLKNQVLGIGDWTIENTLLVSGLDEDIFPAGDYFLRKRIQKLYNLDKIPSIKETEKIAKRYSPSRSQFAWYLWRWF